MKLFQQLRCVKTPRAVHYEQGQTVNGVRQYFYFIDHEGQLFLDDARIKNFTSCFKEVRFLNFFYRRLRKNESNEFDGIFPYISDCGVEKNFVRCDDRPIVYTTLDDVAMKLTIGGSSRTVEFQPDQLCMFPNGRLYHPAPFADYGLLRSALAEDLFHGFKFDSKGRPYVINWKGTEIKLRNDLIQFARHANIK